jgi:pimeloyl-ACP methyl ester carboxylesterase
MGNLLCIEARDGVELHGYGESVGHDLLLLHYHGLAGNFYENRFIHTFSRKASELGVSFLTVNSRAHDHFSDAHYVGSADVLRRGAAHSQISEICSDVLSWIDYAKEMGFERIILQGHSAGAVAVAKLLIGQERESIVGAVFASPTDMVGLQIATHGEPRFRELLKRARRQVAAGDNTRSLLEDVLPNYTFDARTFLDLFEPGGPGDVFDFRSATRLRLLRGIECPLLVFFGGGEEVCPVPVGDALERLENELGGSIDLTCAVIDRAPHSYREHETEVVSLVLKWICRLFGSD